jgi:transcriptional regulator with XRE-family HTH domain
MKWKGVNQMPNIGGNIKRLREAKDLTQEQLAKLLQCTTSTIYGWESGRHKPSRYGKAKLAEVLGVTVEELEKGE